MSVKCECADFACPAHKGQRACSRVASSCLVRVDMHDETGTQLCQECAEDAMDSGLFTYVEED